MSKVWTEVIYRWDGKQYVLVSEKGYDYPDAAPVARCDRAAQAAAKQAGDTAKETASNLGQEAQGARARLAPFYSQEMNAQHGFTPGQTNELLNFAEGGAGGATSALEGEGKSEIARTRNTAGFGGALDAVARNRQRALAGASLGVGEADVMGAKALNQEGASGLEGLYKTDTSGMLSGMGIQNQDINSQIQAGKSGWFQNMMAGVNAASGAAKTMFGNANGAGIFKG